MFARALGFGCTLLLTSALGADQQTIEVTASSSGRLYADHSFGDCCTLDAWDSSPNPIWTETCETMGGYCMGGRDVANWVFELPELPVGAQLLDVRFKVNPQSGASGSATLSMRESYSSTLGTSAALQVFNSPQHSQSAYFSGTMVHSFSIPVSQFLESDQAPYMAVALFRSNSLSLLNSGSYAPTLEFTFEAGPPCDGDVNDDGVVEGVDLAQILAYWGQASTTHDLDGNGVVGATDLAIVLARWGACSE